MCTCIDVGGERDWKRYSVMYDVTSLPHNCPHTPIRYIHISQYMYTVTVACMVHAWASTSTQIAWVPVLHALAKLARKAASDHGSFASLIVTYTRCYLQCERDRRFCVVVRPFVSDFWRNCGVTRCKIAQNSCAKTLISQHI